MGTIELMLMKKILLLTSIFPIVAIAQVEITDNPNYKPISLEGIGRFKIDQSTTALIDSISKENNVPVQETVYTLGNIPKIMGTIKSIVSIYELEKNSTDSSSDVHAMRQKGVRVFYLNYYNPGDVNISNIYVKFYRDTLIEFECNPTPSPDDSLTISEAFRNKYGEPGSVTTMKKTVVCKNGSGGNFNNYEESFTSFLWVAENRAISAFEFIDISYPDCKVKKRHVFTITDDQKNKIVDEDEKKLRAEMKLK
jgi:hypothetical protein